jgi:hypothetical protein
MRSYQDPPPRLVEGIPDGELVKVYLGELAPYFRKTHLQGTSIVDGHVWVTCYIWDIDTPTSSLIDRHRICVKYSKSRRGIIVTVKGASIHTATGWIRMARRIINITDPEGPQKAITYIKTSVNECSSNQDFEVGKDPS